MYKVLVSIALILVVLLSVRLNDENENLEAINDELMGDLEDMASEYAALTKDLSTALIRVEDLEIEYKELKTLYQELEAEKKKLEAEKEVKKPTRGGNSRVFEATAYCKCSKCCGKWSNSPTKSGTTPVEGRTIAVDPNVIPLGSKVLINGSPYIAEDTGSAIKGRIVDIYFDDHNDALSFGRQKVNLEIIERGS